jgi:hypothetical protein
LRIYGSAAAVLLSKGLLAQIQKQKKACELKNEFHILVEFIVFNRNFNEGENAA